MYIIIIIYIYVYVYIYIQYKTHPLMPFIKVRPILAAGAAPDRSFKVDSSKNRSAGL